MNTAAAEWCWMPIPLWAPTAADSVYVFFAALQSLETFVKQPCKQCLPFVSVFFDVYVLMAALAHQLAES